MTTGPSGEERAPAGEQGAKPPATGATPSFAASLRSVIGSSIGLAAVIWVWWSWPETPPPVPETPEQQAAQAEAQQLQEAKWQARQTCQDAVRQASKFPTKADFSHVSLTHDVTKTSAGYVMVEGRVELMNGRGAMVPHLYVCTIGADGKLAVPPVIQPG